MNQRPWDLALVGGGLANAMIAWRLASTRPDVRWCLLEGTNHIGGTSTCRTWSYHVSDLALGDEWVRDLESRAWTGYEVRFATFCRRLEGAYASIRSSDLHGRLTSLGGDRVRFSCHVKALTPTSVHLASGERVQAAMVVDGRGTGLGAPYGSGYQKFLGRDVRLAAPHGLGEPILMDATVDQGDGYRFVYVLPWDVDRLLIEDTYYGLSPSLDDVTLADGLDAYAGAQGWTIVREEGRERGVLPIPLAGEARPQFKAGIAASGVRAGRFNPTTGYSLAAAARLATEIAQASTFSPILADRLNGKSREAWHDGGFFRRLNNMLFLAARPEERWRIMAQFYGRDEDLIRRFYSGELSVLDRLRLLSGKAPVPLAKGVKAFFARPSAVALTRMPEGASP